MGNCSKGSALLYAYSKGRVLDMAHRLAGVWLLPTSLVVQGALH